MAQLKIPQGFPGAGQPAPNNDMTPVHDGDREVSRQPLSRCRTTTTRTIFTTTSTAGSSRPTAPTSSRGSTGTSATAPRPTCASRTRPRRPRTRAACGGDRRTSRCRRRTSATNVGRSVRRQRRHGAEPDDDQRGAGQLQPPHARQPLQGSERHHAGRRWHHVQRHLPRRHDQPVSADRPPARVGRQRSGRQPLGGGQRRLRAQRLAAVQRQADQAARHARDEVRPHRSSAARSSRTSRIIEAGQLWFGTDNNTGTGNSAADMLVGPHRPVQPGHRGQGQPVARRAVRRIPLLGRRRVRAGQLEAASEPDGRVRRALRPLDQQPGAERPGRLLHPGALRPDARARSSTRAPTSTSTASATSTRAARRPAFCPTARPFALPRVNVAWDIDGQGNNVVRGGYGMFYNRNMGNVEYDQHAAPGAECLRARDRLLERRRLRQRHGSDLRHRCTRPRSPTGSAAWASTRSRRTRSSGRRRTASACRTRGGSRGTRSSRPATSAPAGAICSAARTAT